MDAPEAELHEVEDVAAAGNEEDLHNGVVEGDVAGEQVEVARHEDGYIERLGLERDSWRGK